MNGNKLLADTNILLYFLKGNPEVIEMLNNKEIVVSFITELELLCFPEITDHSDKIIRGLLKNCSVIELNPEIKELAIEFRRKSRLKLPDSIIAATAFYLQLPLITADHHFRKVEALNLIFYDV
ncbi:MAG TPA: type II toxin-antitoxin system VapC family toxin [Flavobacteriaceae bacterium]|nr:type II toxin-antitoxin system VapC family toxin [Flavobacteriaceae bacterium]